MENDLHRELGIFGPNLPLEIQHWCLDPTEGPARARIRMRKHPDFQELFPEESGLVLASDVDVTKSKADEEEEARKREGGEKSDGDGEEATLEAEAEGTQEEHVASEHLVNVEDFDNGITDLLETTASLEGREAAVPPPPPTHLPIIAVLDHPINDDEDAIDDDDSGGGGGGDGVEKHPCGQKKSETEEASSLAKIKGKVKDGADVSESSGERVTQRRRMMWIWRR